MAGTIEGFDADEVRAGLRIAMGVGLPVDTADQPLFCFPVTPVASTATDSSGTPFDWQSGRNDNAVAAPVHVPCAMEYTDASGGTGAFGVVSPSHILLTLLDEDFEQVKGFDRVIIGGNVYFYQRTLAPLGLVSVGIWQVLVRTDDEG